MILRLVLICIFSALWVCQGTLAQGKGTGNKPLVHFAGLAYSGSYQHLEQNFKHTLELNKSGGLDRALFAQLSQSHSPYYRLEFGLADIDKGESLVMAVAMEREFINREVYNFGGESFTRVIGDLTVQILIINFSSLVIEASYRQSFAINDVLPGNVELTPEYERQLFKKLYLGNGEEDKGFLSSIAQMALNINPTSINRTRIALRAITFSNESLSVLPENRSQEQLEHFIGSAFTAKIAENVDVQVIPYTRDYAIGGQMATRFSNGKVYNLKLPTPNLVFDLELVGFKKEKMKNLIYAVIMRAQLKSALQEHLYWDDFFRSWVRKYEGESVEDWPAYEDAIELLLSDLAKQLVNPSRQWLSQHAKEGSATFSHLKKTRRFFTND